MCRSLDKTTELPPLLCHLKMLMADDDKFKRLFEEFRQKQAAEKRRPKDMRHEESLQERLDKDRASAKGLIDTLKSIKLKVYDEKTRESAENFEARVREFLRSKNLDWELNFVSGGASNDPMLIE